RYRGTFELILDTDSEEDEEVEETSDSDSEREDAEDEGPTIEDGNPAAGDEGLAEGDEGPNMEVKSRGLDDEGHSVESDGFSLGEEEAVLEGAQLELYRSILQDHTQRLDVMPPTLFAEIDRDERTAMTFGALWRPVLALEAWAWHTALERELQEIRGRVTALEKERDCMERVSLVGCITEKISNANSDRIVVTSRTGS
nr:hypothetical protein [Tanacetum cinerariifolium]